MQLNLTQMEFAKELGFGFATISRWENGVTRPTKLKEYAFNQFCKEKSINFVEESK